MQLTTCYIFVRKTNWISSRFRILWLARIVFLFVGHRMKDIALVSCQTWHVNQQITPSSHDVIIYNHSLSATCVYTYVGTHLLVYTWRQQLFVTVHLTAYGFTIKSNKTVKHLKLLANILDILKVRWLIYLFFDFKNGLKNSLIYETIKFTLSAIARRYFRQLLMKIKC